MKKVMISAFLMAFAVSNAQIFDRIIDRAKEKTKSKTEQKTEETIDKGLNKIEEGIGNIFKKKENQGKTQDNKTTQTSPKNTSASGDNTDFSQYKKFDFVPAKEVIFFENFSDRSSKRWNSYEPITLTNIPNNSENWLEVKAGRFHPIGQKMLPKNFTLEFDVYTYTDLPCGTLEIEFVDKSQSGRLTDPYLDNSSHIVISPITQTPKTGLSNYNYSINNNPLSPQNETAFYSWLPKMNKNNARISISRNGNKLSAYINEEKILDNVEFFSGNTDYFLTFHLQNYFVGETRMYFTNFRLASGVSNATSEISNSGKFVTNSIYFDVNSSRIKPESWSTLKQSAEAIKATSGNILIIGHTDSDGNDDANLALSKKRAESVKNALVKEFGIDASKLTTDGKGESVPLNKNATPAEKAQNRRVEFVKQ